MITLPSNTQIQYTIHRTIVIDTNINLTQGDVVTLNKPSAHTPNPRPYTIKTSDRGPHGMNRYTATPNTINHLTSPNSSVIESQPDPYTLVLNYHTRYNEYLPGDTLQMTNATKPHATIQAITHELGTTVLHLE